MTRTSRAPTTAAGSKARSESVSPLVQRFADLAAEYPVRVRGVRNQERQDHEEPREDYPERGRMRRGLPDRQPIHDDVGEEAVRQTEEGNQEED